MSDPFPDEIDEALWDEACRRADAIRGFLKRNPDGATAGDVAELAAELGLSQATAYRLIKLFRAGGTVVSLVDRKRGRPEGHRALDEKREEIIRATIKAYYLKRTRPTVSQLVRDVQTTAYRRGSSRRIAGRSSPALRISTCKKRAKRRGEQKIVKATTPVPGLFGASRPLEVVQIDHTKADVFVVDEETRQPLGRPWLTLAMDVCSRMVTGFYLTMEAPSRLSTSLCLLHSVFDKSAWLREREITEPWPVAGLPDTGPRRQRRRLPQPGVQARMPGCRHRD
jgi:putative transposase